MAFEQVRPLLAKAGVDGRPHALGAELHALRATWLAEQGGKPEEDLENGRVLADEALSRNPHLARANLAKGMLHLVEARRARGKAERERAARKAKEACAAALRSNPSLERDHDALLKEVEAISF